MPDEPVWAGFFDPDVVLSQLGLDSVAGDVVDFGCGYGTFSLAMAPRATGVIHAIDIDEAMVRRVVDRSRELGLKNVRGACRDFVSTGTGLEDNSARAAMVFNILHAENPVALLHEAFRVIAPGGIVAVIHWIHDPSTPRGPTLAIRPKPEQVAEWLRQAGFEAADEPIALPPYHYGLVGNVPAVE